MGAKCYNFSLTQELLPAAAASHANTVYGILCIVLLIGLLRSSDKLIQQHSAGILRILRWV
jgi:hypothetical protein